MISAITPTTQTLLDLIHPGEGRESSQHTDAVYESLIPLHDLTATVLERVGKIERAIRVMEASEAPEYEWCFGNQLRQTCSALKRELDAAARALDSAGDYSLQLDRYASEMKKSLITREDRTGITAG